MRKIINHRGTKNTELNIDFMNLFLCALCASVVNNFAQLLSQASIKSQTTKPIPMN